MNIVKTNYDSVKHLYKLAKTDNVCLINLNNSTWFSALNDNYMTIGCVCLTVNKYTSRFRGDYVLPEYRKKGLYKYLFKLRLDYCLENYPNIKRLTAFTTPSSIHTYKKNGFNIIKTKKIKYNNDFMNIYFVERILD